MGVPSWDTFFAMIGPFSAMIGHVFGLKLSHRMIGVQAERFLTFFFSFLFLRVQPIVINYMTTRFLTSSFFIRTWFLTLFIIINYYTN